MRKQREIGQPPGARTEDLAFKKFEGKWWSQHGFLKAVDANWEYEDQNFGSVYIDGSNLSRGMLLMS